MTPDTTDLTPEGSPANFDDFWSTGWCEAQ